MAPSTSAPVAGTTYPTSRRSPGRSSRTITAACRTDASAARTASISPSSIRNPRTFTWSSARPRYSSWPAAFHRARSPVRYIRSPPAPNGHPTNRSPVSPGRPAYPRASPAPATYSSPATPAGTGPSHWSRTYTRALATGDPIGGASPPAPFTSTGPVVTITVASVGPYVFTSRRPAAHRSAQAPDSSSAPDSTVDKPGTAAGSSTPSSDGTTLAAVTPAPVISSASSPGSARCAA